jgi:hypothetical protein
VIAEVTWRKLGKDLPCGQSRINNALRKLRGCEAA